MTKILFVCTGNSCRSPMAAAIALARIPTSWRDRLSISSAGTAAVDGMKAAPGAVKVLGEMGIDLKRHRTRFLTKRIADEADLIVTMTEEQREEIVDRDPRVAGKVIVLGELDASRASPNVVDPIGGDEGVYRNTRDEIAELISRLIDYISERFGIAR